MLFLMRLTLLKKKELDVDTENLEKKLKDINIEDTP